MIKLIEIISHLIGIKVYNDYIWKREWDSLLNDSWSSV